MTLLDYIAYRDPAKKQDFNKLKEVYLKGCQTNWSNPNTVDVKSVNDKKSLAIYLSKYIAKAKKPLYCVDSSLDSQLNFGVLE